VTLDTMCLEGVAATHLWYDLSDGVWDQPEVKAMCNLTYW